MRRGIVVLALTTTLAALACTTVEDDIVTDIGVAQLVLIDPDLAPLVVDSDLEPTIQATTWTVTTARLTVGTIVIESLLFDDPTCDFFDGSALVPVGQGKCARGFVLDADGETREVRLELTVSASFRWTRPLELPADADIEGDGVANGLDNCPLIDNPEQTDTGGLGFGDACSRNEPFSGSRSLDNDRDGVPDASDNCPAEPNPLQENTDLLGTLNLNDGIGDACTMETAVFGGPVTLEPDDLLQVRQQASFLTVDFSNACALSDAGALECDFVSAGKVRFCVTTNPLAGCP